MRKVFQQRFFSRKLFFALAVILFLFFSQACVQIRELNNPSDLFSNFSLPLQSSGKEVGLPSGSFVKVNNDSQQLSTANESAARESGLNSAITRNSSNLSASQILEERFYPDIERDVFNAVNEERVKNGLPALKWADDLSSVARNHSRDMGLNGFFAHENLQGKSPFDRISEAGINYSVAGENLGLTYNYPDQVKEIVKQWMNSPSHRKNILDPEFEESGVGVYKSINSTYYYTHMFVKRPSWYEWINQKVSIAPNAGYIFMRKSGDTRLFKYTVSSDYVFDAYWVPDEKQANAAVNGELFSQYAECSATKTANYASNACLVPGNSGLVIINKNLVEIKTEVKIYYYS
ncbi:CAP domain-containing protein [Candidatus Micrarchaeota archaeon]|nr:CAP domain-containing protein [Candidatus Micrarchaeota archaeon]